ncbi:MAG: FAD-dependent oxidoreductase, partial [Planctomycetes bacterium]|nr:FAD-dependent oxidoreductase [Planctomycetota bacterium]
MWSLTREIPFNTDYDVIVLGGGPAGCTAAAAAGREGMKTLLVEHTGALGGMGTSGLVPAWCPFSDHEKIVYRGLAERVFNECKEGMKHVSPNDLDWVSIDPEHLKRVYDDLVSGFGVEVLFNSMLSAVEAEDGQVKAAIISNKAGLTAYGAKVFIDCTGDADLVAWAGAEYEKGDEDGNLQSTTLCFMLSNVDEYGYRSGEWLHPSNPNSAIHKILDEGKYPDIPDRHACNQLLGPGVVGFNAGHVWEVDNTKPETVSKALMKGRKIAKAFRDALAEYMPAAFGNAFLAQTAPLMGIRETRRICGDYKLTVEDYLARQTFPDEIC